MKRNIVVTCFILFLAIPSGLFAQQFNTPTYYVLGRAQYPGQIISADLNNDGKLDLAICDQIGANVAVLLGNGDGTFQAAKHFPASYPLALAVADFNGDGIADLALLGGAASPGSLMILLGNGDGTFRQTQRFNAGYAVEKVVAADLNGDGRIDLALIDFGSTEQRISGHVVIFFGNGNGTFQRPVAATTVARHPMSLTASDLNNDGYVDLVVTNYNPKGSTIYSLLNNGTGTFSIGSSYQIGMAATAAIADLNHDGIPDLVLGDGFNLGLDVLLGHGDGTFDAPTFYPINSGQGFQNSVIADFNRDGVLDIAYATENGNPGILYGNGDGTFQAPVAIALNEGGGPVTVGDFNGDGWPDLAFSLVPASQAAVLINAQ